MSHIPGVEFRPLTIPASVNDTDAADFREFTRVRNLVYREMSGNDDDAKTPAELLPHYQSDVDEIRHAWAVVADGVFIGRAGVDIPLEEGSRTAYWLIELLASTAMPRVRAWRRRPASARSRRTTPPASSYGTDTRSSRSTGRARSISPPRTKRSRPSSPRRNVPRRAIASCNGTSPRRPSTSRATRG